VSDPARARAWRHVLLLSAAQLLAMGVWFAPNAAVPELRREWGLSAAEAGALTSAVQVGFVVGTAAIAVLNLADLVSGRWLVPASAVLAAAASAGVAYISDWRAALFLRALTGVGLAGVYPPAMKMTATWFREGRGLAIGVLIGALTFGKATPFLLHTLPAVSWRGVVLASSALAFAAAVAVAVSWRDGPFTFERRPFSLGLVATVARHRETRLAVAGYLGHMWELYAMWTWVPAFLAASLVAARGSARGADALAFATIGIGALGCIWGGWAADRMGRVRLVTIAMAASGTCALLVGFLYGASPWLLVPLVWAWGVFVIADSAQFSALVTEVAPAHAVGTALALQTSLGFLLTTASIQLVAVLAESAGWRWAFPVLAVGPALGIAAIQRLGRR
jgi:MFS family permease